jgi:phosphatidylserine synthase
VWEGFNGSTFPVVTETATKGSGWRSWPANALTLTNMGAGALVCWWAASEFDLGWAPAEWLDSLGFLQWWMDTLGIQERRVAGLFWLLAVWMFGQLCDLLDGLVARAMGAQGDQGAMLDSMADLVSSGLAPAFVGMALMMEWRATGGMPPFLHWAVILPLTVMLAAAWRLARFTRLALASAPGEDTLADDRVDFEGVPAPFAAVFWGALVWSWAQCPGEGCGSLWVLGLIGSTLLPLCMVSTLPQMGFKHWGGDRSWDLLRAVWLSLVFVCFATRALGGALALISYPLMGALAKRFSTRK